MKKGGVSIFIAVILLIVAAVGVFYLVSKPFSTQVKEAARQATQWTPENIKQNPTGYLSWAVDECREIEDRLQTAQFSIQTKIKTNERKIGVYEEEFARYAELLDEAKPIYQSSADTDSWPVTLRGNELSQEQLKALIVDTYEKKVQRNTLLEDLALTTRQLTQQTDQIEAEIAKVTRMKGQLSVDLERVKIRESAEDIGEIADRMGAILDTSTALQAPPSTGPVAEDLMTPSKDERMNTTFERIMAE